MRTTPVLAVLAALLGATGTAQFAPAPKGTAQEARVFQITSLSRFDDELVRDERMGEPVRAIQRLTDLVQRLGGADPKLGPPVFQPGRSARGEVVIARGTTAQLDVAARVFEQLRQPEVVRARLQCSIATMPVAVARAHGLKPGEVVATDEPAAARIVRDAVKADGTLRNLPEVIAAPLAPFARDTGEKDADKQKGRLRLRGEMLPLTGGEVALGVHVVRDALPHDPTRVPDSVLMQPVFQLAAGRSALFMVVDRDTATVLVVRCLEVTNEPPPVLPPVPVVR